MHALHTSLFRNLLLVLLWGVPSPAWITPAARARTTRLHDVVQGVPEGLASSSGILLKEAGEAIIRSALLNQGCSDDQFQIEWKPDKIIVTVKGPTYLRDDSSDDDDEEEEEMIESAEFGADPEEIVDETEVPVGGVNIVELSRAVRAALEMDDIGTEIGEKFEIEVTTPGAPDELTGIMWQSYRGFDVIVEYFDVKKDTIVFLDARLVERNDEHTVVNIKGRMKKLANDIVKAVRLPKAKKEKGG